MVRAVPEGEEKLAACQSCLTVAAHAHGSGMGVQGYHVRVQFKLIGNQIPAFLLSKGRVADIHPVSRHNPLNGMVVQVSPGGCIDKAVHCIGR